MSFKTLFFSSVVLVIGFALGINASSWGAVSRPAPGVATTAPIGIFKDYAPAVIQALKARGLSGDCPMCKKNQWVVHEYPISVPVYETDGKVKYPGTSLPAAAMICRNCGFMSIHSLGALDLLNANGKGILPGATP